MLTWVFSWDCSTSPYLLPITCYDETNKKWLRGQSCLRSIVGKRTYLRSDAGVESVDGYDTKVSANGTMVATFPVLSMTYNFALTSKTKYWHRPPGSSEKVSKREKRALARLAKKHWRSLKWDSVVKKPVVWRRAYLDEAKITDRATVDLNGDGKKDRLYAVEMTIGGRISVTASMLVLADGGSLKKLSRLYDSLGSSTELMAIVRQAGIVVFLMKDDAFLTSRKDSYWLAQWSGGKLLPIVRVCCPYDKRVKMNTPTVCK